MVIAKMERWLIVSSKEESYQLKRQIERQAQAASTSCPELLFLEDISKLLSFADKCNLVILSSSFKAMSVLNIASILRKHYKALKLLCIQAGISSAFEYRAHQAGISQLIEGSKLDSYNFILKRMDTRSARKELALGAKGTLISTAAVQGGVGLSSWSYLLAAAFAQQGFKLASVHLNAQMCPQLEFLPLSLGQGQSSLDSFSPADFSHAFESGSSQALLARAQKPSETHHVFSGCSIPERYDLIASQAFDLVAALSMAYELRVLELPILWDDLHIKAMLQSERVYLVLEERAGALLKLSQALSLLKRCGLERTKLHLVINKSRRKKRDRSFVNSLLMQVGSYPISVFTQASQDFQRYCEQGLLHEYLDSEEQFALAMMSFSRQALLELGLQRR